MSYRKEKYPLVSIITPCYNAAPYLDNYFRGILSQSYPNIELIFVDDGSIDKSADIANVYREWLVEQGYGFQYIYQDNAGQAAAVNRGLAVFRGDYMMWLDADDILCNENIEKKVNFLEKNTEYGFVMCQGEVVSSDDIDTRITLLKREHKPDESRVDLFKDLIAERNVVFPPGVYMAKAEAIRAVIKDLRIYESREGQNFQLLLPLAYHYKCGYIDEVLFKCVSHSDSHSRIARNSEQEYERKEGLKNILVRVVKGMNIPDEAEILNYIDVQYARAYLRMASRLKNKRRSFINEQYSTLKRSRELTIKDYIWYVKYVLSSKG